MKMTKITPIYQAIAERTHKNIFAVPVNDKKHVEIMFNDNSMTAYIIEDKKLTGVKGFNVADSKLYPVNVAELFASLNESGIYTQKVAEVYRDTVIKLRNVK